MKPRACLRAFVLLAATLLASCAGTRHSGHLGVSKLADEYAPLDEPVSLGWTMTRNLQASGVSYELGAQAGADTATLGVVDVTTSLFELYGGARYEWVIDAVRPHLSGGASLLTSEVEAQQGVLSASDNDTTIGLYLGAGIDFDVSESVFVGLGVRQTFGHDPTFAGLEADGDFTQVLVRVGGAF